MAERGPRTPRTLSAAERQRAAAHLEQRAEAVRAAVRITEVLEWLGVEYHPGRRIHCIFPNHPEKNPAMQVYEATDSVYCYACTQSGDVVEVIRKCASTRGRVWSRERAVHWIEQRVGLTPPPLAEGLGGRLSSRLGRWRARTAATSVAAPSVTWAVAEAQVRAALFDVLAAVPGVQGLDRAALGAVEDYVWAEADVHRRTERPPLPWAVWATGLIRGYYTRALQARVMARHARWAGPADDPSADPLDGVLAGGDAPLAEATEGDGPRDQDTPMLRGASD